MVAEYSIALTRGQRRLWTLAQLRPGDPFFNHPFAVDIDGPLDLTALRTCLAELVRRHASLRSRITPQAQVVEPAASIELPVVEVTDLDRFDELAERFAEQPFDLERGPLLRVQLLRRDEGTHRLVVNVHHIVFDGRSLELFINELAALYEAEMAGLPVPLPPAPDYQGSDEAGSVTYWTERLAGAPEAIALPAHGPRPNGHRGARRSLLVCVDLVDQLRAVAKANRVTMFMLLKAAWDVVLHQYGTPDILMATALSGRDSTDSAGVIGYLAKPVVLRSDLRDDPSFRTLLTRVRGDVLDAHEHPDLPFEEVVSALRVRRDPGHHPLYQVMFSYDGAPVTTKAAGATFTEADVRQYSMKVDLSIGHRDVDGGLLAELDYRADLLDQDSAALMLASLHRVLARIPAGLNAAVSQLVLPDVEPEPVAGPLLAGTQLLHELVSHQALRTPDAPAVGTLTYRELVAAAERLAVRLAGIGRIGICLPASAELVVAVLAAVRASATVVALDPARPAFQLRTVVDDAAVADVIADARTEALLDRGRVSVIRMDNATPSDALVHPPASPDPDTPVAVLYIDPGDDDPSGVVLTHRNLAAGLQWARDALPADTFAQVPLAVPSTDTALFHLFAALTTGGALTLAGERAPLPSIALAEPGTGSMPGGTPLPGSTAAVLDANLRPVATGAAGVLHLAGSVVPAGYLDRPELSARRLLPDGRYATGELVWRTPDGRIVALHRPCAERPFESPQPAGPIPDETPATDAERTVAAIWAEVLGKPVGRNQNFFDAGGNSLLLVRLHDRLQQVFGRRIDVIDLFRHSTQATMAGLFGPAGAVTGNAPAASRAQARQDAMRQRARQHDRKL